VNSEGDDNRRGLAAPYPGAESYSSNIRHLGALDDLRAVAALMVVFAHILHNLTRGIDPSSGDWLRPSNPIFAVLAEGHAGVSLFMVLSGFLFGYGAAGRDVRYGAFIRNRLLRIFPMYLLVLALGAYSFPEKFSFIALLSSVTLFGNTSAGLDGGPFTILLWTISVEFTFYLLFPFLNTFSQRYGRFYLPGLLALFIGLRILCVALGASPRNLSYFTIVGRMDQFLIGMIAAHIFIAGHFTIKRTGVALVGAAFLLMASLYGFNRLGGWVIDARWKVIWHTYEALIFAALILAYLAAYPGLNGVYRRVMGAIGAISYSIYLLHMPILMAFQKRHLYSKLVGVPQYDALVTGLYIIPIVLGASWITYTLIERPFLSLRVKYLS